MISNEIAIIGALRTPFGRFGGAFAKISAPSLAASVIEKLLQFIPSKDLIDYAVVGCALPCGLGQAAGRNSLFKAGISDDVPAFLVNKVCGSGMQSHVIAHMALRLGEATFALSGGMENMTQSPYFLNRFNKTFGDLSLKDSMIHDGLIDFSNNLTMGELAEVTAEAFKFSRKDQEKFAIESAKRALAGYESDFFANEIVPVSTASGLVSKDEPLARVCFEKIANLPPAFGGTITAATSSAIADGAAFTLMTTKSVAEKYSIAPLAYVKGMQTYAHDPKDFLTAPVYAIEKLLSRLKWTVEDVDFFEINEAFAVAPMIGMKKLAIPREKINFYGGACALGHPLGATGARLIVTLTHILQRQKARKGIAALCIGGGEGMAIALERPIC